MAQKLLGLDEAVQQLRQRYDARGLPPEYVRYCEGVDPSRGDGAVSKRLFIGETAIWIDLSVPTSDIKAAIEKLGYVSYAELKVPDGSGKDYASTYFQQPHS